ncbi:hypothetical protein ACFXPX_23890 [Kitasatospora sp. NPDC059146]|uniref:hypothetical protein n=1 Tax=unclassified Kitasatospora TaxID=2633591 RepID=UPI0036818D53
MTMVATDDPYSLATFLGAVEPFADVLRSNGLDTALDGLDTALARAARQEVASVVHGFLGLDMIDLLAGGWRTQSQLAAAARETCAAPGSEEVVALLEHRVRSVHQPSVNVLVDGVSMGTLEVDIEVVFELDGIVAVVRGGRLVAVRAGRCTASATVALERIPLLSRRREFDLPGGVGWRRGMVLRHCTPTPPPPPPPTPPG